MTTARKLTEIPVDDIHVAQNQVLINGSSSQKFHLMRSRGVPLLHYPTSPVLFSNQLEQSYGTTISMVISPMNF
jgi:hypothetical protein